MRCAPGCSRYTQDNQRFLRLMVQNALEVRSAARRSSARSPSTTNPAASARIDLKTRGTRLFVDCARVFALAHGIAETGTAARLRSRASALRSRRAHVEATTEAFHFLQLLRLRQQAAAVPRPRPTGSTRTR